LKLFKLEIADKTCIWIDKKNVAAIKAKKELTSIQLPIQFFECYEKQILDKIKEQVK
jgi:hypothetical protein